LRPRVSKGRAEEVDDLGGDTGTSNNDDVEDETYVDYGAYERRMRHGKGPASHHSDEEGEDVEGEEEDLGGQERDVDDEGDDPMDTDDGGNVGGLRVTKPIYFYHDRPIVYHGEGMTRKLKKLREVNPYDSQKTASHARFWAKFQ
jgi:hypothetical protein